MSVLQTQSIFAAGSCSSQRLLQIPISSLPASALPGLAESFADTFPACFIAP